MKKTLFLYTLCSLFLLQNVAALPFQLKQKAKKTEKLSRKIHKKLSKIYQGLLTDCDTIIKKDGEEISAKIVEISEENIKYKKCDFQDGPAYVLPSREVFMVKFSNGTKHIPNPKVETAPTVTTETTPYYTKPDNLSILSIALGGGGLLLFFLLGTLGLLTAVAGGIVGFFALRRIRRSGGKLRGKGLAWTGIIAGGLAALLLGLVFLVALAA